jgi:Protein of unknown function (DUF2924)
MNAALTDQIAGLPAMNKAELLSIWANNFSQAPPASLRKDLMVPILAYRIQEREYGGLANAARKRLRDIAKSIDLGKQAQGRGSSGLHHGTRLVRSWKGEVHEVQVSNGSFTYRGKQFSNLSQIAREITGTRWSGPVFFGTKVKAQ